MSGTASAKIPRGCAERASSDEQEEGSQQCSSRMDLGIDLA